MPCLAIIPPDAPLFNTPKWGVLCILADLGDILKQGVTLPEMKRRSIRNVKKDSWDFPMPQLELPTWGVLESPPFHHFPIPPTIILIPPTPIMVKIGKRVALSALKYWAFCENSRIIRANFGDLAKSRQPLLPKVKNQIFL